MTDDGAEEPEDAGRRQVLAATALMAAGTVLSRASGVIRAGLLAAALGLGVRAEVFNIANTVPNMLYILLAGGVMNAVLVPQLVRSMANDGDDGEAYVSRVVSVVTVFLVVVSVALVLTAPWIAELYLDSTWNTDAMAAEKASVVAFLRMCLPQVFFYGMFVLLGQVLNARGVFGPMMWAPIANNLVSIGVLVTYLVWFGPAPLAGTQGEYGTGQELLLGLGATAGIVAQFLVLLPYLRASGVRIRPRFDLRGSGLGHTLRLGWWTVLFVIVNQVAYAVVVNLASSGTSQHPDGTGYTVYSNSFLIAMVPHSVITVSLATAILPRLSAAAAGGDLAGLGRQLISTVRLSLVVMLPFAALLPILAPDLAKAVVGYGSASSTYTNLVPTLSLFGVGMVFFTIHYLMLRGFYALEATRAVFFIQCAVGATNIVVALLLVAQATPRQTAPALVLAYIAAYAVGSLVSAVSLSRRLRGLGLRALAPYCIRLLLALAPATGLAWLVSHGLHAWLGTSLGTPVAVLIVVLTAVTGALGVLAMARPLRISEANDVVATLTGRIRRRGRS